MFSMEDLNHCLGFIFFIFLAVKLLTLYNFDLRRPFIWAPHGPLWKNLRRFSVAELLSTISVQKSSSIREDEVRNLFRHHLLDVSAANGSSRKVDLTYLFNLLTVNVMLMMAFGKAAPRDKETEKMERDEYLQKLVDGIRLQRTRDAAANAIENPSVIEKLLSFQEDPKFFSDEVIKGTAVLSSFKTSF
ncbi:hypothetical protein F3Y22_tig00110607pilonHSYRG00049 [Hibiscus syriacus]|uniref:Cytochrome P450 n=1 Tax=Hibiscus syriacus TaxID=106335 RepID=A0A6A3A3V7_HIBSY|nr:hypothetical protein F3Y22_tig00110607pilonHSYRG00049 [Hibiscus syriacus]